MSGCGGTPSLLAQLVRRIFVGDTAAVTVGPTAAGRRGSASGCVMSAMAWRYVTGALAACVLMARVAAAIGAEEVQPLPPIAEEMWRRSACAAAGEQILAGNFISSAVYQEQFTRYSTRTNRCYVEMRVETIAADDMTDRLGRYLYDGETKELLAFAQITGGRKSGRVFDLSHRTVSFENAGWDDASEYIYVMMAGEK
jgi:hypothetical protein